MTTPLVAGHEKSLAQLSCHEQVCVSWSTAAIRTMTRLRLAPQSSDLIFVRHESLLEFMCAKDERVGQRALHVFVVRAISLFSCHFACRTKGPPRIAFLQ